MHKRTKRTEQWVEATGKVEGFLMGEPRPPRLEFEGACYHVYNRGNCRERIFWDDTDYREFEDFLLDLAGRMNIDLYAWCLMPNHFHFLIVTPEANLSAFMQRLLGSYARYFNRAHRKIGHVFQGRYGSKLCDRDEYLLELVRYIHLNPYRTKKPLEGMKDDGWPWSSHRYYVGGEEPMAARPPIHTVLRRFSDDLEEARRRYAHFVSEGLAQGNWEDFYKPKGTRFLGSDRFIEESKRKAGLPVRQAERLKKLDLQTLALAVARQFQMEPARFMEDTKERKISHARQTLVYLAKRYGKQTTNDLARYLRKDPSTISHLHRRAEAMGETEEILNILFGLTQAPEGNCG